MHDAANVRRFAYFIRTLRFYYKTVVGDAVQTHGDNLLQDIPKEMSSISLHQRRPPALSKFETGTTSGGVSSLPSTLLINIESDGEF